MSTRLPHWIKPLIVSNDFWTRPDFDQVSKITGYANCVRPHLALYYFVSHILPQMHFNELGMSAIKSVAVSFDVDMLFDVNVDVARQIDNLPKDWIPILRRMALKISSIVHRVSQSPGTSRVYVSNDIITALRMMPQLPHPRSHSRLFVSTKNSTAQRTYHSLPGLFIVYADKNCTTRQRIRKD